MGQVTAPPRRAAKYRRISEDREGLELGVNRQDEDLDELGNRRGLIWAGDYVDNDAGASTRSTKRRPRYEQMLRDARAGKFDVIAAYTTGRVTRRPREFEDLIDLAQDYGIEFMYIRSPEFDLRTAQGRRIARMLAAQDAGEAEEIAERVQRDVLRRARQGEFHGGPKGYGVTADGRSLVKAEAAEIRRWCAHVMARGSLHGICTDLANRGVVSPTGKSWRTPVVRRIVMSPRIAGLRFVRGVEYKAPNPQIVPVATWRAVVRLLEDPARKTNHRGTARRHLGTGLFICLRCQVTLNTGYNVYHELIYKCLTCWRSWRAMPINDYVDEVVAESLTQEDARERLLPKRDDDGVDFEALSAESTAIGENMAELSVQFGLAKGATRDALKAGLAAGEARLAEINSIVADVDRHGPLAAVLLADDPVAAWRGLEDLSRRQALVRALMTVELDAPLRGRPGRRSPKLYTRIAQKG